MDKTVTYSFWGGNVYLNNTKICSGFNYLQEINDLRRISVLFPGSSLRTIYQVIKHLYLLVFKPSKKKKKRNFRSFFHYVIAFFCRNRIRPYGTNVTIFRYYHARRFMLRVGRPFVRMLGLQADLRLSNVINME